MIDILMVTYNRPAYTRLSLPRLLETCTEHMRVWLWHNGNDPETLEVVKSLANHPRVCKFHHSPENKKIAAATNWMWSHATGDLLGKVDDDCLMPDGWAQTLERAHRDVSKFGVLGCWGFFRPEDFREDLARHKIRRFGNHRIVMHPWVGGNSYLMKRRCVEVQGLLRPKESFPDYGTRLAWSGWVNGLYYPLIHVDHMDDPRSPNTMLRTDEDMKRYAPLTAANGEVRTRDDWLKMIRDIAMHVQTSGTAPCRLYWLRGLPHRFKWTVRERRVRRQGPAWQWENGGRPEPV